MDAHTAWRIHVLDGPSDSALRSGKNRSQLEETDYHHKKHV